MTRLALQVDGRAEEFKHDAVRSIIPSGTQTVCRRYGCNPEMKKV